MIHTKLVESGDIKTFKASCFLRTNNGKIVEAYETGKTNIIAEKRLLKQ